MYKETEWSKFYDGLKYPPAINTDNTIYRAFAEAATKYQDRTALVFAKREYTYLEFKIMIDKCACFLLSLGMKRGDRIIICSGGQPLVGSMIYACNAIGVVPSVFGSDFKAHAFNGAAISDDYKCVVLSEMQLSFYSSALVGTKIENVIVANPMDFIGYAKTYQAYFSGFVKKMYYKPDLSVVPSNIKIHKWKEVEATEIDRKKLDEISSSVLPSDLAFSIFENNTLKKRAFTYFDSKAILEQTNLTGFLYKDSTDENNIKKVLSYIDLMYSAGFILGYNSVLLYGHTVCLKSAGEFVNNVGQAYYYKPNVILSFPTILNEFADLEGHRKKRMDYLDTIISFGFPINGAANNRYQLFFDRYATNVRYERVYGVAETASVYIYNPPELENSHMLGIPVPGVRIKIFDDDANELPVGSQGRICVSTPASAIVEENSQISLKRQMRDDHTWIFTGTLGHIDENSYVYFDGSITRKFDINGKYFYPYILENQILHIEGVNDCLVFVQKYTNKVIAAVVPEEKYLFDNDLLLALKENIERETELAYHSEMRQSEVLFLATLPKTNRGENDYAEFDRQYEERISTPFDEEMLDDL